MKMHINTTPIQQYGLTLLEVLIAIVILSVGLLGVASLQAMSKQSSYQAYQRTLAMNLVDGIVERIRANPTAASSYHTGLRSPLGSESISSEPSPDCTSTTCSATQLAAHDLWEFEQAIDGADIESVESSDKVGGLYSPNACLVFTAATGKSNTGTLRVIVSWEGMTDISDAATSSDTTCGSTDSDSDASRRQAVLDVYVVDGSES